MEETNTVIKRQPCTIINSIFASRYVHIYVHMKLQTCFVQTYNTAHKCKPNFHASASICSPSTTDTSSAVWQYCKPERAPFVGHFQPPCASAAKENFWMEFPSFLFPQQKPLGNSLENGMSILHCKSW